MGRTMKKKLITLLLAASIIFTASNALAAAAPTDTARVQPSEYYETNIKDIVSDSVMRYQLILSIQNSIYCDNGLGHFTATVLGQSGATASKLEITIQQYNSGWKNYRTFIANSKTKDCRWIANNVSLAKGYMYRLKITATVYKNSDFERDTVYSALDAA